jgi:hypothetical protein
MGQDFVRCSRGVAIHNKVFKEEHAELAGSLWWLLLLARGPNVTFIPFSPVLLLIKEASTKLVVSFRRGRRRRVFRYLFHWPGPQNPA